MSLDETSFSRHAPSWHGASEPEEDMVGYRLYCHWLLTYLMSSVQRVGLACKCPRLPRAGLDPESLGVVADSDTGSWELTKVAMATDTTTPWAEKITQVTETLNPRRTASVIPSGICATNLHEARGPNRDEESKESRDRTE